MPISRKKILLLWFICSAVCSVIFTLASVVYWQLTYVPEPNVNWSPMVGISGMLALMPIGWLISIVIPAGWLNLIGLGFALYKRSIKPLAISAIGSSLFGIYWPEAFYTMMSV